METNFTKNTDPFYDGNRTTAVDGNYDRDSWRIMVQRIYADMSTLFQREGQLIRTEMNEKVGQVKTASVAIVTSGVVLFIGVQCLAATAIILLAQMMTLWLSAVLVTAAFLIIGGVMFAGAKKKLNADDLKPNKSIEAFDHIRFSLKEKVHEITKH
jgi:hypothetical protein